MDYGLIYWRIVPFAMIFFLLFSWWYWWEEWDGKDLGVFIGCMILLAPTMGIIGGLTWPIILPILIIGGIAGSIGLVLQDTKLHSLDKTMPISQSIEPLLDTRSTKEALATAAYEMERNRRTTRPSAYCCQSCHNAYTVPIQPCPTCGGRVEKS